MSKNPSYLAKVYRGGLDIHRSMVPAANAHIQNPMLTLLRKFLQNRTGKCQNPRSLMTT